MAIEWGVLGGIATQVLNLITGHLLGINKKLDTIKTKVDSNTLIINKMETNHLPHLEKKVDEIKVEVVKLQEADKYYEERIEKLEEKKNEK